jgi:hypothetical protein
MNRKMDWNLLQEFKVKAQNTSITSSGLSPTDELSLSRLSVTGILWSPQKCQK